MDSEWFCTSTNAAEGYFANLKRQVTGTHHSTSKKHLPRYLEEHDFKYNTREMSDTNRTEQAIGKIGETKPLHLYKRQDEQGTSLIDAKQGEATNHKTKRGAHMKRYPRKTRNREDS